MQSGDSHMHHEGGEGGMRSGDSHMHHEGGGGCDQVIQVIVTCTTKKGGDAVR